ncbi:MAG: lipoyl synthase [Spirochaetaceae bacterium]|nr:MAG: lipoyl synthase [Spirochaetaceae bacterium]
MKIAARPPWLRKQKQLTPEVMRTRRRIGGLGLHTVCESARCPNLGECYACGNATFLILGDHCTRNCAFCAVEHGPSPLPDPLEGQKIADYTASNRIRYAVLTSVTRDDLADGGASHYVRVVEDLRRLVPALKIELLVPDFAGRADAIEEVARLPIQVFAHNMETVRELYGRVRRGADYQRSLEVLKIAASTRNNRESSKATSRKPRSFTREGPRIKSGIMVGLGETEEQLQRLFDDLAAVPVEILTIGQYLQPSKFNAPVHRYYYPDEYKLLREKALACGIRHVVAGPYVRSSYLAEGAYRGSL